MLGVHMSGVIPSRRVSRCLFGPVDHSEIKETLRKELAEIKLQDEQRWNFDFANMTPKEGRWEWYPVESRNAPVPNSPRKRHHDVTDEEESQSKRIRVSQDLHQLTKDFSKSTVHYIPIHPANTNTSSTSTPSSTTHATISHSSRSAAPPREPSSTITTCTVNGQGKITDFFVQRKKLLESPVKRPSSPSKTHVVSFPGLT